MSDRDNESGEGRLSRWSRLKTQARAEKDVSELAEAPADGEVPALAGDEPEEDSFVLEDLPDIETLDKDSDFTPFLNVNVPDQLRRLALKKLWASDPVFASLDGLNDYDEDYSTLGMIVEKVSSVFKPGEGMPEPEPEDPQQPVEEVAESPEEPEAGSDDAEDDTETGELDAPDAETTARAQDPDERDDPEEPTA